LIAWQEWLAGASSWFAGLRLALVSDAHRSIAEPDSLGCCIAQADLSLEALAVPASTLETQSLLTEAYWRTASFRELVLNELP
jgi:hypothetical protein